MKRSSQVGLAVMGVAAFAATFASVKAFQGGTGSTSAQSAAQSAAQTCTTRPDGTQNCEPQRRGFSYYLLPHFMYGSSSAAASTPKAQPAAALAGTPKVQPTAALASTTPGQPAAAHANTAPAPKPQSAALTSTSRPTTPAVSSSGVSRGGFGTTAQSNSFRVSAGG
jgi:hypothetical protein